MKKYKHILDHFEKTDLKIFNVMKTLDFSKWLDPRVKVRSSNGLFAALCREIIGQQLSGKAANSIYNRFIKLFESKEIAPHNILEFEDQEFRDIGMSWSKAKYVKDLAQNVKDKKVNLRKLSELSDEEVVKELIQVKGIGNWTAEMFLIFTLGREDVFSFGDLGLRKGFIKVYGRENPTNTQIEEVVAKWKPYRSYGSIALWHSLDV